MIPRSELPSLLRLLARIGRSRVGGPRTCGVQCVAVNAAGEVLVVKSSYRRRWSLPGGFMEHGEDPLGAAQRELAEETGYQLVDPALHGCNNQRYHFDHLVVGRVSSEPPQPPTTSWEIAASEWIRFSELFDPSVIALHRHSIRLLGLLSESDRERLLHSRGGDSGT